MSAHRSWIRRQPERGHGDAANVTGIPAFPGPLTWLHRCDRCGAQAYVRVLLPSKRELLFCAHHGRQHASALARIAVAIQDETARLCVA